MHIRTRQLIEELRRLDSCAKVGKRDILGIAADRLEIKLHENGALKERVRGQRQLITRLQAKLIELKVTPDPQ